MIALIEGKATPAAVRWDGPITGLDCARILSRIEEPRPLYEGPCKVVRVRRGIRKVEERHYESGWKLSSNGKELEEERAGDIVVQFTHTVSIYIFQDGRQMILRDPDYVPTGERMTINEADEPVDPGVIRSSVIGELVGKKSQGMGWF